MKKDQTDCFVVEQHSLYLHFDAAQTMMWMLIVNRSDLMMHSYCSYATLVEVKMGMMMIDSYYLLIVVIAMNSIFCEKSPVLYPYCKDLMVSISSICNQNVNVDFTKCSFQKYLNEAQSSFFLVLFTVQFNSFHLMHHTGLLMDVDQNAH